MANYLGTPSSFFKFCYGDFSVLNIPTAFANLHEEFLRQGWLQLKTDSIRSWNVKIVEENRSSIHRFQIRDGWSEFVEDNDLVEMNFLIFRIAGSVALHVTIFRDHPSLDQGPSSPAAPTCLLSSSQGEEPVMAWRLVKKLNVHNILQRLDIPRKFMECTGIATKPYILLMDARGRTVTVTNRKIMKYSLTNGWRKFLKAKNFKIGDILLFEFVADNVVKVVEMEEDAGRKLIDQAKRGGILDPTCRL